MKKIYFMLLALLAMSFTFTACSDDDPFSTATADDYPRILDPVFPDYVNGKPPVIANINRDANFTMTLTVTPADHTIVYWRIDGAEVHTGTTLDINLKAGTYPLQIIASTGILPDQSTYRNGIIQVNPLPEDPWATEVGFERIVAPGAKARLYGNNLDKVKAIVIYNRTITDIVYNEDGNNSYIEYTVPADMFIGKFRVLLVDADGNEYGANTVDVTRDALIISGADRTNANSEWVMTGVNLDRITSLEFAGKTITEFTRQTVVEIAIICPSLNDGEYTLMGKTADGQNVLFHNDKGGSIMQTVTVSSQTVLWQGHHYVSWDLPDGNPNKTFNLIGKDVFAPIKAGATLSIHYSVAPEAEYHQLRTTSGWWDDLPGTSVIEFSEDGVKDVQLTQEVLDKIQAEDGFLCIGHGYYVDMVTLQ